MIIHIKETFEIASKHLFVIVLEAHYAELTGIKNVLDEQREICFPIFSIEWVNIFNLSMPGITLKYETEKDLIALENMVKDNVIIVE